MPDLTAYPQGRIREMVADLRLVLEWTAREAASFGGDPEQVRFTSQSLFPPPPSLPCQLVQPPRLF